MTGVATTQTIGRPAVDAADARLRLLYVLYRYPQISQTFVRDEVSGLRNLGVHVDVITLETGDADLNGPAWAGPYRHLERQSRRRVGADHLWLARHHPRRYRRFLWALIRLRDHWRQALQRLPSAARGLIESDAPTHCHTHFAWDTAAMAIYLSLLLEVPASITTHAKDIYTEPRHRLRARLDRFSRVVTVCHFNVGFLTGRDLVPFGDVRLSVVPCAVSPPTTSNPGGFTADVLAVGRLIPKKGFDTLIEAVGRVRHAYPDVSLVIVGNGPERARLERLARKSGIDSNTTFVGELSHGDVLDRMTSAKVFCLPARPAADGDSDAMPVVLREAMSRGVPVIASRLAGIPETVDDTVGWLVAPGSVRDLANALLDALGHDSDRRARGEAARARALREWTPEGQATALRTVFLDARLM